MKKLSIIIVLLVVLSACTQTKTIIVTATPVSTPTQIPTPVPLLTVKVLTYNILFGAGVDRGRDNDLPAHMQGKDRSPLLLEYLKAVDADVIGLQEVAGWQKGSPSFIEKFAAELGMNYFLAESALTDMNVAILTKYEIVETEDYSNEMGYEGSLRARLITPDGAPLNVFVVHLDSSSQASRLCATQFMLAKMQPYIQQRTIYMGDMNFRADSPENDLLVQAGWQRVATEPRIGIDQIWISPSVEWTTGAWRTVPINAAKISDHYPLGEPINFFSESGSMLDIPAPAATELPAMPDLPQAVAETLTNPKVVKTTNFDSVCSQQAWGASWSYEKITDGHLEIKGVQDWQSGASFNAGISEGNAILVSFQFTPESEFNLFLEHANWANPAYRRFGMYYNGETFSADMWKGETPLGGDVWEIKANPNTWYTLLLVADKDAHFSGYVWDPADPSNVAVYQREMEADWSGLPWRFSSGANKGLIQIKDLYLIQHNGIK